MPALKPTDFTCTVTWLGRVADRDAALASDPLDQLAARFDGPEGEAHGGINRLSDSRVIDLHPRGTTIRNVRQFSIVSEEDLAAIAARMEIDHPRPALVPSAGARRGHAGRRHGEPPLSASRQGYRGGASRHRQTVQIRRQGAPRSHGLGGAGRCPHNRGCPAAGNPGPARLAPSGKGPVLRNRPLEMTCGAGGRETPDATEGRNRPVVDLSVP